MRKILAVVAITVAAVAAATVYVVAYEPDTTQARETRNTDSPSNDHDCGKTGQFQQQVETNLESLGDYGAVEVDGEQSGDDCTAIVAFQKRVGINNPDGRADELTDSVAQRLADPGYEDCQAADADKTVCVNLGTQTLWVVEDGEPVYQPTVIRSGKPGHTSTRGTFTINHRDTKHWSVPYEQWLTSWQHYYAGEGLHETNSYLHDPKAGSHGCINLLHSDAVELYDLLDYGDTIKVFGKRPTT